MSLQVAALTARVNEARMDRYKLINAFMFNCHRFWEGGIKKRKRKEIYLLTNFHVCFDLIFLFWVFFFSQAMNRKTKKILPNITLSK